MVVNFRSSSRNSGILACVMKVRFQVYNRIAIALAIITVQTAMAKVVVRTGDGGLTYKVVSYKVRDTSTSMGLIGDVGLAVVMVIKIIIGTVTLVTMDV